MARRRHWGAGQVFREPSGSWAIRWREGRRQRYAGGFDSKSTAESVLARKRAEKHSRRAGLPVDPKSVPTLGTLKADFLKRREKTHRAGKEDGYRWKAHIGPWVDHLRPADVDQALIRRMSEAKLAEGLASGTVRILVALLSSLYVELVESGLATSNPARGLPRATRRLIKSSHDPRTTPFVEKLADLRRIFLALTDRHEGLGIGYALGALGGLRPGEAFALRWAHVDLEGRRIHVRESVTGPLKDKESRVVPIQDALLPVLKAWKLKSGGEGRVVPPMRVDGKGINKGTRGPALAKVMKELKLSRPGFGEPSPDGKKQDLWYWCTRHTFASQWVMAGRSIEELKEILGHYSVVVTERYAHLRPDLFAPGAHAAIQVDLSPPGGVVPVENAQILPSGRDRRRRKSA